MMKPATQTWVKGTSKRSGTILVDHYKLLYPNFMCLAGSGIANVKADELFHILVENFGDHQIDLLPHQVVATASEHPENLVESQMSHAEVFGLVPDDRDTKFRKLRTNVRDIETINKNLADHGKQHMGKDEKPITTEDIYIGVPSDKKAAVREMLRKHEQDWSGQLGEIKVTEMRFDLVSDANPFNYPPFRAGPKSRDLHSAEIDKQFKAGIIESAMSEWAAPVLFVPKNDSELKPPTQ